MKLLSFDYYYEKILLRYQQSEEEKASQNLSVTSVIKVMVRSLQMYETIEQIILIFTLLGKVERLQEGKGTPMPKNSPLVKLSPSKAPQKSADEEMDRLMAIRQHERHLIMRLRTVIKQLVYYNKFMQKRFIFKGQEMMQVLDTKVRELNVLTQNEDLNEDLGDTLSQNNQSIDDE